MKNRTGGWYLLFIFLLFPLQVQAGAPQATVETQVNKILEVLRNPEIKGEPEEVKRDKVRHIINEIFDYRELSKRTLGRNWRGFNQDQQLEFVALFSRLLEMVYMGRLLEYTDEKVVFVKEIKLSRNKAEVQSKLITNDGKEIPLFYRLIQRNAEWRVYDISIEGISMIKNYRTQFNRILSKNSAAELIKILQKKTA